MISAIYNFALTTGANRVIRGARIEHVCGDPTLSPEKDYAFGMRIVTAELEIARPGESVRIWPVRDVIEPRIKVAGPGVCYPGICGRDIATVGEGRTHRLAGMGVVEVSSVNWHDAGGDFVETYLDMSGP